MSDGLFQIFMDDETDDEAKPRQKRVGRLTDMDTQEVSVVDRAANQRRFLMVKRNNEENNSMSGTATKDKPDTTTTNDDQGDTTAEVSKSVVIAVLEQAQERVGYLQSVIDVAKVEDDAEIPASVSREVRGIQFMLKALAGVHKSTLVIPIIASGEIEVGAVTKQYRDEAVKVLAEVDRRISTLKSDLEGVEVLDTDQQRSINATADLLAKVQTAKSEGTLILAQSVSDELRASLLSEIEKSMDGLLEVYVALQTDAVAKNADIADEFEVCSTLDGNLASLEQMIAEVLIGKNAEAPDPLVSMLMDVRSIQKNLGTSPEVADALSAPAAQIAVIAKAGAYYCAEYSRDGYKVILKQPEEKVAEYDTYEEAKFHALKLNVQAIVGMGMLKAEVTKTYKVERKGDKFAVHDGEGNVKGEFDNPIKANAAAAKLNASEAKGKTKKDEEGDDVSGTDTDESTQTDTGKIGRPMQGDRLNRLKSAVSLLKDALGDLRSGSVSMEKFKKVGDVLAALINELQVAKRDAATKLGGEDKRDASTAAPNVGSGYSGDQETYGGTMDDVMGEGTGGTANLLKRMEAMVDEKVTEVAKKKDAEIAKLQKQLKQVRKAKGAPSAPPQDDAPSGESEETETQKNDSTYWPADLAAWDGDEDRD